MGDAREIVDKDHREHHQPARGIDGDDAWGAFDRRRGLRVIAHEAERYKIRAGLSNVLERFFTLGVICKTLEYQFTWTASEVVSSNPLPINHDFGVNLQDGIGVYLDNA